MKPRLLVMEDEPAIPELLAEHLVHMGSDADVTSTIEDATKACRASPPDRVLLDIGLLPEGDGRDFCR